MPRQPRKLLDQVRDAIRLKHYSIRTEQAYVSWIKRYILFHNKRHPKNIGSAEITAFLTHLAVERNVAASTQNPCTEPAEVRPSVLGPEDQGPSAPCCSCTATCSKKTW